MDSNGNVTPDAMIDCDTTFSILFVHSISGLWAVFSLALIFVISACVLSFYLIYKHLKFYTQPEHQRYIVRIICMVPLYSVYSLLSLVFHKHQVYFAIARDCYEAYALYMFFKLCVNYAGGQAVLVQNFLSQPKIRLTIPLCFFPVVQTNELFFSVCRQGMLQYVLLRPIVSIWAALLQIFDLYGDGEFSSNKGYPYAMVINNICVTMALYVIVLFEQSAAELLHPYRPVLKFLSIKIVIFLAFWQSVVIAGLVHFGWFYTVSCLSVGDVAIGLQNFLICFEMFFISVMHIIAYPYELYRVRALTNEPTQFRLENNMLKNVANMFNHGDLIDDARVAIVFKKKSKIENEPPEEDDDVENKLFGGTAADHQYNAIITDPTPHDLWSTPSPQSFSRWERERAESMSARPVDVELESFTPRDIEDLEALDLENDNSDDASNSDFDYVRR